MDLLLVWSLKPVRCFDNQFIKCSRLEPLRYKVKKHYFKLLVMLGYNKIIADFLKRKVKQKYTEVVCSLCGKKTILYNKHLCIYGILSVANLHEQLYILLIPRMEDHYVFQYVQIVVPMANIKKKKKLLSCVTYHMLPYHHSMQLQLLCMSLEFWRKVW